jgi:hypothetical protein
MAIVNEFFVSHRLKSGASVAKSACLEKVLHLRRFYSGVPPE